MAAIKCWLKRFKRSQQGVTALEYALVAPLFFTVLFLSIEITFMLLADATLDRAASRVARMGKIGIEGDCKTAVMGELNDTLSFWADKTRVYADATIYTPGVDPSFGDIDDEDYTPVCNAGGQGDMVVYRLGFEKPGLTGLISLLGLQVLKFERIVIIQNEP